VRCAPWHLAAQDLEGIVSESLRDRVDGQSRLPPPEGSAHSPASSTLESRLSCRSMSRSRSAGREGGSTALSNSRRFARRSCLDTNRRSSSALATPSFVRSTLLRLGGGGGGGEEGWCRRTTSTTDTGRRCSCSLATIFFSPPSEQDGSLCRGDGDTEIAASSSLSTDSIPERVDGARVRRGLLGRRVLVEVLGGDGFIVNGAGPGLQSIKSETWRGRGEGKDRVPGDTEIPGKFTCSSVLGLLLLPGALRTLVPSPVIVTSSFRECGTTCLYCRAHLQLYSSKLGLVPLPWGFSSSQTFRSLD
jgi:hypothetical protein